MSKQGEAGQFTRHRRALGLMVGLGMVLASTSFSWAALTTSYPFQDRKLPLETRLNDLVGRLTLDEKLSMFHQHTPAIARLGVPAFRPGTEGLHGISWLGKATVFPQATGYGCTWDTELIKKIGAVVGDEARGYHLKDEVLNGLAIWAPVVDLERDPRAGRFEEGYGEDPFLVGQLAIAYCKGIKGDDPFYYKAIPTLKHFYAYNQEANRDTISVALDDRNKNEYYLKSFRYPVEAGVAKSLMTSYNLVNGIPCTIAPEVNIAKNQWTKGKDFYVVTDAFAPNNLTVSQAYFKTGAESHAAMIKAGIDNMTQDSADPTGTINNIKTALDKGMITVADIDRGVRNILRVRFHLGDFDADTKDNPYDKLTTDEICAPDHSKLALQAAQKQLVLLKNDQNFLPLQKKAVRKVAVIGPLADQVFTDFYSAPFPYTKTVLNGVQGKVTAAKVVFSRGVDQIALKSTANNCYVTAPAAGGQLAATAQNVSTNETYDLYDFGWGQYLFRSTANDKYLSGNGNVLNTANAPGVQADGVGKQDWFTWQNFNMESQSDGTYALYNYQVSHWDTALTGGKYVTVAADSKLLTASAATVGGNEKFQKVVLSQGKVEAAKAASGADVAIVVVGNEPMLNGRETIDRPDIILPPSQEELIKSVAAVNQNTIVVVVSSYPMAIGAISQNPNIKAILYSSHGGQEEGTAIADALFGDYAPAGRLNATWYSSVDQLPAITEYDIIKGKRTYMYFEGKPLYPFGYGLTYTTFKYSDLRTIRSGEKAIVQVKVKNTGKVASDEVVQLYVKAPQGNVKRAIKELKGFKRIHLKPKESQLVRLNLPVKELAYWDVTRKDFYVEPGVYQVMVGRSSADIQVKGNLKVCSER